MDNPLKYFAELTDPRMTGSPLQRAYTWLEPDDGKLSCPVLRGGSVSNDALLPDFHGLSAQVQTGADRLEVAHRPAGAILSGRHRKVGMVRTEMEDRDLPQDPQVRMPCRRSKVENRRAAGELDRHPLHLELADLLDHDAPSNHTGGITGGSLHGTGPISARRTGAFKASKPPHGLYRLLHSQAGAPRRLSRLTDIELGIVIGVQLVGN